jgi:dienelactone hydrolase
VTATRDIINGRPGIEFFLYPGIGHAFMNPARPTFDAAAADLARRRTIDFLGRAMRTLAA